MRHLRERNLYLIVFNGLSYGQPIFIYIDYTFHYTVLLKYWVRMWTQSRLVSNVLFHLDYFRMFYGFDSLCKTIKICKSLQE